MLHSTLHTLHSVHRTLHSTLRTRHSTLDTPHSAFQTPHSHSTLYTPNTPHSTLHTLHTLHPTLYIHTHTPHSTLHSTMCTLHCALYTTRYTLHCYTLHCALYTVQSHSTPSTPHFTLHPPRSTLYIHPTLHTQKSTLHTPPHSTLRALHSTLSKLYTPQIAHTPHCTSDTPEVTLYVPHFRLYTPHCALHSLHCALFTPHSPLFTADSTVRTLQVTTANTTVFQKMCLPRQMAFHTRLIFTKCCAFHAKGHSHDVSLLPRHVHVVTTWRSPDNSRKTHNTTRLNCCPCHTKWPWRSPKCCPCHEKINSYSENLEKVWRLSQKTAFDTLWHDVTPRLKIAQVTTSIHFCSTRCRHGHRTLIADGCGRLRMVADGCGRLRTVANGKAALSEHISTPRPQKVKREPFAIRIPGKGLQMPTGFQTRETDRNGLLPLLSLLTWVHDSSGCFW